MLPVKTSRLLLLAALLISAAVPMTAQVNDTYVIPAAANAQGGFGSRWMTRFSVFNPWLDYPLRISVTFVPTGGAQGIEELIDVPPNSLAYSDNILRDLFDVVQGSGSLLVATFAEDNPGVPDDIFARSFLVTSDTYNNAPNGTYGQTIAGTWTGLLDYEHDQISSVAHGIRNGGKWRTNVGALNLGRCTVTLRVNVYDADGNRILNQAPFTVPPLGHIQHGLPVAVENGTVEFFSHDPCFEDDDLYAVVFPYTSTIDGESNDPAYQNPTLLASTDVLFAKGQKVDPTAFGKKIDSAYARGVRAQAERRGVASLKKTEKGWQIAK
jgi:hypothetical protein